MTKIHLSDEQTIQELTVPKYFFLVFITQLLLSSGFNLILLFCYSLDLVVVIVYGSELCWLACMGQNFVVVSKYGLVIAVIAYIG